MLVSQASPMLSGDPSVLAYFDLLADEGAHMMHAALESAMDDENKRLRKTATSTEEWRDLASQLSVRVSKDALILGTVTRDARRQAKVVEYGSGQNAPVPILRKHMSDTQGRVQAKVTEYFDKALG